MATKKATNVLDILLGADVGVLQKPRKSIPMKRLSEALGQKIEFVIEALSPDQFEKIQDNALTIRGKDYDVNVNEMQIFTVLEGVVEPNLKSKELRDHFGAPTPKELVKKLLISGEISRLYNEITDLSGFGEDIEDEVKN